MKRHPGEIAASSTVSLEAFVDVKAPECATRSPFVGVIVDSEHPTLSGRVLVRWSCEGGQVERWLPALQGLALREGDRVIITKPENWAECVVTGVIDGFARRTEARRSGPSLALRPDECLRITDDAGKGLVEVVTTPAGPVIRLLERDVALELEGRLRVVAREVELVARDGDARITAEGDVIVRGDTVQLN
jgi:hypothetical protein